MNYLLSINPVILAFWASLFTFLLTTLGSSIVFLFREVKNIIMDIMLGLASGIMLASSFFSLLNPAVDLIVKYKMNAWSNIFLGFTLGCCLIYIGNIIINYLEDKSNNSLSKIKRDIMLFSAITLHNIPEGLVIGVSYSGIEMITNPKVALISAISLTIGIGVQNFPEGCAISLPLRRDGISRLRAFLFGTISGLVEPISAVLGALLVIKIKFLLPFILSFTAGAMIYVVIDEMIPESQKNSNNNVISVFILLGFLIMMMLEIVLK